MRITPELLRKLALEHVNKRLNQPNDIVAVYLTGSVLGEEPLLGGTTDIDLVMVHKEDPPIEREIVRISYEISLDIVHHHQSYYSFHRRLRLNPWLGYALCNHDSILYDTDHWLEFIQAGVYAQFERPENIYGRALPLVEKARSIWFELESPQEHEPLSWFDAFFKSVGLAANAVAVLNGPGLPTRRFLLELPARTEAAGKPGLFDAVLGLMGINQITAERCAEWRQTWEEAITAASKQPTCPPNLLSARKSYFTMSCDAMLESGNHQAASWMMLETWLQAVEVLWQKPIQRETWLSLLNELGFEPQTYEAHTAALDAFLDISEQILDEYKSNFGL